MRKNAGTHNLKGKHLHQLEGRRTKQKVCTKSLIVVFMGKMDEEGREV